MIDKIGEARGGDMCRIMSYCQQVLSISLCYELPSKKKRRTWDAMHLWTTITRENTADVRRLRVCQEPSQKVKEMKKLV